MTVQGLDDPVLGSQCSFNIESGGTLTTSSVNQFLISATTSSLSVAGTINCNRVVMDRGGQISVSGGGKLACNGVVLKTDAKMNVTATNAVVGKQSSGFNLGYLLMGPKSRLEFASTVVDMTALEMEMMKEAVIETQNDVKDFTFTANTFTMYDLATLNVTAGGDAAGTGAGTSSTGASFGGQGGKSTKKPFGSVVNPTGYGSGCGAGVRGGGRIVFNVTNTLTIDGQVVANGAMGSSTGGASGGTIVITANTLSGHGDIHSQGGEGDGGVSGTPGGSGGRIALNVPRNNFIGYVSVKGGQGSEAGASGTVYSDFVEFNIAKQKILADNEGLITPAKTGITDGISGINVILEVNGEAIVEMISSTQTNFQLSTISGDYSGTLFLLSQQTAEIAVSSGIQTPYALPCKVHIEQGATCKFSPKLILIDPVGSNRQKPNLYVEGTMSNVRDLIIGEMGQATFTSTSNTKPSSTITDPPGTISFSTLSVISSGILRMGLDSPQQSKIQALSYIQVHYGGSVYGSNLDLSAPNVSVSFQGLVSTDGNGSSANTGSGKGSSGAYGKVQYFLLHFKMCNVE